LKDFFSVAFWCFSDCLAAPFGSLDFALLYLDHIISTLLCIIGEVGGSCSA